MNAKKLIRKLLVIGPLVLFSQNLRDCFVSGNATFDAMVVFIFQMLTGGFGSLIMIVSGIGAILAAAFGQYRAALSALVVALGVYVLQIFITAFFGTDFSSAECFFELNR
jgi:type IV secretory pathway VirB2 component (pilin)